MNKGDKTRQKVLSGRSDANIAFDDLCHLLLKEGFSQRRSGGSHVIFQRGKAFLNLQRHGAQAKAYQVRQVREALAED